ncbi:MAG: nitroreductase [Chitinophagales bacterium]|jgi:nitroreductase|tara:strand:+ start:3523 stop:4086 length:564 start_codon:yes stop_codon:yes gene_type:complete
MDAIEALLTRNSSPKLCEPAPSQEQMETVFQAALRAPDHARLRPWRYAVISGDARNQLGELFVATKLADGEQLDIEAQHKLAAKPLRAPMIIAVAAHTQEHPKVPLIEQQLSAGTSAHAILLALHALGYAGVWRTGSLCFNPLIRQGLGFADNEQLVAFLYVGSRDCKAKPLPELATADYVRYWSKA